MKKLSLVLALAMILSLCTGLTFASADGADPVEITFLSCWNGGGGSWAQDQVNNPVMQEIIKQTGVVVKMESIVTSETEKLNTMFASGVFPDFVSAPYWQTTSGEGKVIKDAATQGMIYDITDMLADYPNVARLYEVGVAAGYKKYDLFHPDYEGRIYLIPQQTPSDDPEDITNWTYACYARGDIIEALGVDPTTITSPEALIELGKQIRDGGFTDAVGNPVIPFGTWHNGWSYGQFVRGYDEGYNISSWRIDEDGKLYYDYFRDRHDKTITFIRTLIKEGLLDVECFSNTDTLAKEKMAVGKIAIFGAQNQIGALRDSLYLTNPEMEFVLLGPQIDQSGNITTQVEVKGRSGTPVLFMGYNTEHAKEVMSVLDYVNSDEGRMVVKYGIEGVHYTINERGELYEDPELKAAWDEDPWVKRNLGIDNFGTSWTGANDYQSRFPKPEDQKTKWDKLGDTFKAQLPVVIIDKISMNFLERGYEKYDEYRDAVAGLNFDDELKRAFFAETDEEAAKILDDIRNRYNELGLVELTAYMQETYDNYENKDELGF